MCRTVNIASKDTVNSAKSMTHMLNLEDNMTGLKRKPSELPGDQPPPKLLKQSTSTTISTAFERDSDIDNIPPPILEKADTNLDERPIAVPYKGVSNDNGSNSSTPPPILSRFPTLQPTRPVKQSENKYFGFEIPSDEEEDDDTILKLAESISVDMESENRTKDVEYESRCIGTNTNYDSNGANDTNTVKLKHSDTVSLSENNGSNGEAKKIKLSKKGIMKKVISPKKSTHLKKDTEIKKEKSVILDSLESLRTIQKLPSGTIIEKIMKFGAEEVILPSNRSLAVYEFDDESKTTTSSLNSSSVFHRDSLQVVSDTLKSIENESTGIELPRLDCVSSEELSELSDTETNNAIPSLQKTSMTSPTKSPKKFIHGGIREIVFSFDTTGSMYSYMEEAKDKMRELVERLKMDIPGVRLAFMAHGDYYDLKNDRYLIKWLDFGATIDEICNFFEYLPITHGGDADECYELVLRKVRESLSWTTGSQRCLVMIGDSDPHEPGYQFEDFTNDIDWKEEAKKLCEMGVRIYGMQVGYRSDFYRQISQMTGGAHLRLDSAHLTPDMLMSVCLREGNLKLLKTFEAEVMKRPDYKGGLDLELARLFSSLKNVADNIAMKFKKNLIEGTPDKENGKKIVKRSHDKSIVSPGTKIANMAKKAMADDGKIIKKPKLSPEKEKKLKKLSGADKIAKNLIKKAIKGTKDRKKTTTKESKKMPTKKCKKMPVKNEKKVVKSKEKKTGVKSDKKTPVKKDVKKKKTSKGAGMSIVKKSKIIKGTKTNVSKIKQTATKLKAKAVIKAILKSKKPGLIKKSQLKGKLKSHVKGKKTQEKIVKSKTTVKPSKPDVKSKTLSKVKSKVVQTKKVPKVKSKIKATDVKKKVSKKLPVKKKEITKTNKLKKVVPKKLTEKKSVSKPATKTAKEVKKKVSEKDNSSSKKPETKKAVPVKKVKRPKNLQPREIASIAKFVTGPLSCLTWEPWCLLIAHDKQKSGNWSKGKGACPGYCNSDLSKTDSSVPVMYEFAVSPPDSSKKYPVCFYSGGDVLDFCKNKHFLSEVERVIKSKGMISVRKGTINKNDDALFVKTVEHINNMFDYAWNSNSSKDTARKTDLIKEGFILAKV